MYSDSNMARQGRPGETKMEGELLALTYGAVVARVLKDYERTDEVNAQVYCLITSFLINTRLAYAIISFSNVDLALLSN